MDTLKSMPWSFWVFVTLILSALIGLIYIMPWTFWVLVALIFSALIGLIYLVRPEDHD